MRLPGHAKGDGSHQIGHNHLGNSGIGRHQKFEAIAATVEAGHLKAMDMASCCSTGELGPVTACAKPWQRWRAAWLLEAELVAVAPEGETPTGIVLIAQEAAVAAHLSAPAPAVIAPGPLTVKHRGTIALCRGRGG